MSAGDRIVAVARGQVGYVESGGPHGNDGNQTKYWDWWDSITGEHDQGASWCGCFVSWVYDRAGVRLDPGDTHHGPGFIYCPQAENFYRNFHRVVDAAHARPGAVILFHFPGEPNEANHTGILESFSLNAVTCIEGNTSPDATGRQSNGGGVYRRTRPWSNVRAICIPPQLDVPDPPRSEEHVNRTLVKATPTGAVATFKGLDGKTDVPVAPDKFAGLLSQTPAWFKFGIDGKSIVVYADPAATVTVSFT